MAMSNKLSDQPALLTGLINLIEGWRSTVAHTDNDAIANIVEECAKGVEDVIDASCANYGEDNEKETD